MWYSASTNNGVVLCHAQCGFDLPMYVLSWLQVFANLQKFALTKLTFSTCQDPSVHVTGLSRNSI